MKIPLMIYDANDRIVIVHNKKMEAIPLPFKPYAYCLADRHESSQIPIEVTDLFTKYKKKVIKFEFDTTRDLYDYLSRNKMNNTVYGEYYIDSLLMDYPDIIQKYPSDYDIFNFDIETMNQVEGLFPNANKDPIISIAYKHGKDEIQVIDCFDEEKKDFYILEKFIEAFKKADPSIVCGFNLRFFDIPYITKRCLKHKLDITWWTRNGSMPFRELETGEKEYRFYGRIIMDIYENAQRDQNLCYDDQTEVLTNNGWKYWKDVNEIDTIATLNDKTNTLEYHLPDKLIVIPYKDDMYFVKSNQINLCVTKDHDLYAMNSTYKKWYKYKAKRKYKNQFKNEGFQFFKPNEIIHKRYKLKKNVKKWHGKNTKYFYLPLIKKNKMDFNLIQHKKLEMNIWLEFLGYFLSEGSISHCKTNGTYNISISQSLKANPDKVKIMMNCIIKLGYKPYYDKCIKTGGGSIIFKSKQLYFYLKQFGHSKDKFIPNEFLLLNKKSLRILFNALMLGDGSPIKLLQSGYYRTAKYKTTSKKLADNIQEIILKLGFSTNILINKSNNKNHLDSFTLQINTKQNEPIINQNMINDKWIKYDGIVYCCNIKNNIIYVRRNGYPVWSGNCGIKNRKLKTIAKWYKIPHIEIEYKDINDLVGSEKLREYNISDVNIVDHLIDIYLPVMIQEAEELILPLGHVIGTNTSYPLKIFHGRYLRKKLIFPFETNEDRYRDIGYKFQAAIVNIKQPGYHPRVWKVDVGCVDEQTEILTNIGWKHINELPINDHKITDKKLTFASIDIKTGNIEYLRASRINSDFVNNKDMIHINNKGTDQLLTYNHKMVVQKRERRKGIEHWKDTEFIEAQEKQTYIRILTCGKYEGSNIKFSDDYIKLLAWIITEGSYTKSGIVIYQSDKHNPKYIKEIREILQRLHISYYEGCRKEPKKYEKEFHIHSPYIHTIFKDIPKKIITRELLELPLRQKLLFIDELIKGDGHFYKNRSSKVYVSYNIKNLELFQELCILSGYRSTINYRAKMVHIHKSGVAFISGKDYENIKYTGIVWCPTFNKNHTWIARRNGKVFVTGNSMYPSIIKTLNLGPDTTTFIEWRDKIEEFNIAKKGNFLWLKIPDENFQKTMIVKIDMSTEGFLKKKLTEYYDIRYKIKTEIKKIKDKKEKEKLKAQSNAIKIIMNAVFGYQGMKYSRHGDMAVAMIITSIGRYIITKALEYINKNVISTDTDGIYSNVYPDVDELNEIVAVDFRKRFGVESFINFELEEECSGYFYKEKNYVLKEYDEVKNDFKYTLHGVSMKTSRAPVVYDYTIMEAAKAILDGKNEDELWQISKKLRNLNDYDLHEFLMRTRIKDDEYKNPNALQPILKKQMEEKFKIKIKGGDSIEFYKTEGGYTISSEVHDIKQLDMKYYLKMINIALKIFNIDSSMDQLTFKF